jgi:hypothetical protein
MWIRRKPEWVQALLIGLGTALGAGTFWYKEIHEPALSSATLTITPVLETIGQQGGELLVRASLQVENRSSYRVYVPAFFYSVRGVCLTPRAISVDSYETAVRDWATGDAESRFNQPPLSELVLAGRPSPRKDTHFDPSSQRRYEVLFLVPLRRYDALRMEVNYMVTKDVSEVEGTRWVMTDSHDFRDQVYLIRPQPRPAGQSFLQAPPTRTEAYDRFRHADWLRRARAGWGWSHATLSLWPQPGRDGPPARPSGSPGCASRPADAV